MSTSHVRGSSRIKLFAAVVGGSAVLATGALTAAMHEEQTTTGGAQSVYLSKSGDMSLGNTATTTVDEATVLATAKAVPPVKATQFGES
jgi:type IV secretory pathway TrbL component